VQRDTYYRELAAFPPGTSPDGDPAYANTFVPA
jgi:hypothetical protein